MGVYSLYKSRYKIFSSRLWFVKIKKSLDEYCFSWFNHVKCKIFFRKNLSSESQEILMNLIVIFLKGLICVSFDKIVWGTGLFSSLAQRLQVICRQVLYIYIL